MDSKELELYDEKCAVKGIDELDLQLSTFSSRYQPHDQNLFTLLTLPQGEIRILTNGISVVTSVSISSSETSNFQRTECSARVCAARRQQPLCATLRI